MAGDAHRLEQGDALSGGGQPPCQQVAQSAVRLPAGLQQVTGLGRGCSEIIRPGLAFSDFVARCPPLPAAYCEQAYGVIVHGIGVDDESPNIPLPGDPYTEMPEGEFRENMVLAVECYAGKVGARDGVKLEDEVWVSAGGPVVLSRYPYDTRLLG